MPRTDAPADTRPKPENAPSRWSRDGLVMTF
jgi:hypothetical protein